MPKIIIKTFSQAAIDNGEMIDHDRVVECTVNDEQFNAACDSHVIIWKTLATYDLTNLESMSLPVEIPHYAEQIDCSNDWVEFAELTPTPVQTFGIPGLPHS